MATRRTTSKTAEPPSETRPKAAERIRRTAREPFYREGIRAIGVEEIVSRAGVTKPSLYRSYASKDELAAEYLRDYEAAFWEVFDAGVQAHPGEEPAGRNVVNWGTVSVSSTPAASRLPRFVTTRL